MKVNCYIPYLLYNFLSGFKSLWCVSSESCCLINCLAVSRLFPSKKFENSEKVCWLASAAAILEIDLWVGVIPFNVTPRRVSLNIFLSIYSQRVQKPWRTWTAIFCAKFHLIHRGLRTENYKHFVKKSFCTGQRVVSRPLRPIARMALDRVSPTQSWLCTHWSACVPDTRPDTDFLFSFHLYSSVCTTYYLSLAHWIVFDVVIQYQQSWDRLYLAQSKVKAHLFLFCECEFLCLWITVKIMLVSGFLRVHVSHVN